jgi:hypothetical protein
MAAQALREPAKEDATNLIADLLSVASNDQDRFLAGYLRTGVLKYQRTCAANLWPPMASFAMECLGS